MGKEGGGGRSRVPIKETLLLNNFNYLFLHICFNHKVQTPEAHKSSKFKMGNLPEVLE